MCLSQFRHASGGAVSSLSVERGCPEWPANRQRDGHTLTCADVCGNSGPLSEKDSLSGPMRHVSVSFRHASGGTVSSLLGVVVLCILQITQERLF